MKSINKYLAATLASLGLAAGAAATDSRRTKCAWW